MGIITEIPCSSQEDGKIVINARMLSETLRKLPNDSVRVETDVRQIATIESGEFKTTIIGMNADDYPELPSISGGYDVELSHKVLKDMIRKTIFSAAVKDSNIVHTGVKFEIEPGEIKLIAVDGFRLAVRKEAIDYSGESISFIVPAKTLSEVVKLFSGDENATVSIGVGKRHIIFEIGSYTVVSRLLDGEFLNYRSAIPNLVSTTVRVQTQALIDSIERTSLIITDKIKSPLRCMFDEGLIRISSTTSLGSANDKIPAEITGASVEIGFNNRFLLEALRVCDTDEVYLQLNGSVAPILIVPPQGDSFLFLILPVRLKAD